MIRNMLHGPWKEASSPVVTLKVDDKNVNAEAIAMALAYLYGHHPKLNDINAFRVLAAASFLDLQVKITKKNVFFLLLLYIRVTVALVCLVILGLEWCRICVQFVRILLFPNCGLRISWLIRFGFYYYLVWLL